MKRPQVSPSAYGDPAIDPEKEQRLARRHNKRPDMSWRDHLVMLLYFGAEIEHSLMVQYLYAAYSINENQPKHEDRLMMERWRSSILSVAREEMGHLLTVQNLLVLLGAPVNFYRRDFPWTTDWYPFPPRLEKFSERALACYIYAEMPQHVHPKLKRHPLTQEERLAKIGLGKVHLPRFKRIPKSDEEKIVEVVTKQLEEVDADPHRVGALYHDIVEILKDPDLIPDAAFDESTYVYQASWDEWGRGYKPDPYHVDIEGSLVGDDPKPHDAASERAAHVMVGRMATREQAIQALRDLSSQGEAPHVGHGVQAEPSHFDRFIEVYKELMDFSKRSRDAPPARNVPTNPTTRAPSQSRLQNKPALGDATSAVAKESASATETSTLIEADCALRFAELFNLRYRIMLNYLAHVFRLARVSPTNEPSRRAMVMHRVFGEMYNLKALSGILTRLPLTNDDDGRQAGPPFEMPYSLILPSGEANVWREHLALLRQAEQISRGILEEAEEKPHSPLAAQLEACGGSPYLKTLLDLDRRASEWMTNIMAAAA